MDDKVPDEYKPKELRLVPPEFETELDRIGQWVQNPLLVVAQNLRALTLEQITEMCNEMGDMALRDKLVGWAISRIDGTPMPKSERRF